MKFSSTTTKRLEHYVYALVDPRDHSIFYVGKASANNRAFDHLRISKGEEEKHQRIGEIRATGGEPEVEILRYGLKSARASLEVEAAVIDAIGLENLTNKVRGHGIDRGRQRASEVERLHGSKAIAVEDIRDPYMLFFINQTYSPTKTEQELYDCTRLLVARIASDKRLEGPRWRPPVPDRIGSGRKCRSARLFSLGLVPGWKHSFVPSTRSSREPLGVRRSIASRPSPCRSTTYQGR